MYGRLQGDNRYLMLFLVGALFLLIGAFVGTRENELDRVESQGKHLDAWVVGAREHTYRTTRTGGSSGRSTTTDYYITVRFIGPDGRTVEGSRQVGGAAFDQFEHASPQVPLATSVVMDVDGTWYAQPELDFQDNTLNLATALCVGFGLLMILLGLYQHHRRLYPGKPPRSLYTDQPPGAGLPVGENPGRRASGPPQ